MGTSTTIAIAAILFGALLIYAGWTNRSVRRLVVGDARPLTAAP